MPAMPAAYDDDVVDLTAALVATDTVNPGLVPGAAGERAAVDLLAERLAHAGFTVEVVDAAVPDRPSLIAWSPAPPDDGPTILLNGHLDTVGVEGMADPFTPRIDGDRLFGRGACDMLGGVAALVVAAEQAVLRGIRGRVVLALVADEEDASLGTEAVIPALAMRGLAPDVAVVAEPTGLDLAETHRGYAVVEVVLTGRAAHTSAPEEGVNAVTHLGRLLGAVEAANTALAATGGSLMVTVAQGGTAPFTLADRARAVVERRTVGAEVSADTLAEVQAILDRLADDDPTVAAEARLLMARESWRMPGSGPAADLADRLADAITDTTGRRPQRVAAPYWTEAALWQGAGIPTLLCGPGGGGLHAADEWVDLAQVRVYAAALVDALCGLADGW